MSSVITTISIVVGTLAVATLGLIGYYVSPRWEQAVPTPSPVVAQQEPAETPLVDTAETPVAPTPSVAADWPTPVPQVQGITTITPSPKPVATTPQPTPKPTPKATPTSTPRPAALSEASELRLEFVDTPSQVRSGESFTVQWRVRGPSGVRGDNSTLKLSYENNKESGGSHSSVSNNSSTSLGSFTVPKTFSSKFSFGGDAAEIHLTATAEVGDQTLTANKTIQLQ